MSSVAFERDFHWWCSGIGDNYSIGDVTFNNERGYVTIANRTFAPSEEIDFAFNDVLVARRSHSRHQILQVVLNGEKRQYDIDLHSQPCWWWHGTRPFLVIENTATGEMHYFQYRPWSVGQNAWFELTPIAGWPAHVRARDFASRVSWMLQEWLILGFYLGLFCLVAFAAAVAICSGR